MVAGHVSSLGPLLPRISPDITGINDQHTHCVSCVVCVVCRVTRLCRPQANEMGVPYYMVASHDPPKDKIPDNHPCLKVTADRFPCTTNLPRL
jgi:hypothetical protein